MRTDIKNYIQMNCLARVSVRCHNQGRGEFRVTGLHPGDGGSAEGNSLHGDKPAISSAAFTSLPCLPQLPELTPGSVTMTESPWRARGRRPL